MRATGGSSQRLLRNVQSALSKAISTHISKKRKKLHFGDTEKQEHDRSSGEWFKTTFFFNNSHIKARCHSETKRGKVLIVCMFQMCLSIFFSYINGVATPR